MAVWKELCYIPRETVLILWNHFAIPCTLDESSENDPYLQTYNFCAFLLTPQKYLCTFQYLWLTKFKNCFLTHYNIHLLLSMIKLKERDSMYICNESQDFKKRIKGFFKPFFSKIILQDIIVSILVLCFFFSFISEAIAIMDLVWIQMIILYFS